MIAYTDYEWNQPTTVQFPGDTTRNNSYDGLQRHQTIQVTDDSGQSLMNYQYTWDETGNITEKVTEHGTYTYGYDEVNRLTEAQYPTFSAEQWTYDPLGNRLTDTRTGSEQWDYNENNELLDSIEHTHEYDDNGSLVAERNPDGSLHRTFEYNAENRMSAVKDENGDLIAEYLYDPFGRRVKKTVYNPLGTNPETTWYVYSDQGLMAELDDLGNSTNFYLFPPLGLWSTDPILRKSGSSYYYYQTDHLGTPQQLINKAGSIVHSREMRAFGETQQTGIEDRWRFPGQLDSQGTGLYYNYFRRYAARTGRYTRSDPIGVAAGNNIHSYVSNSPDSAIDPWGLKECCDPIIDTGCLTDCASKCGGSALLCGFSNVYVPTCALACAIAGLKIPVLGAVACGIACGGYTVYSVIKCHKEQIDCQEECKSECPRYCL